MKKRFYASLKLTAAIAVCLMFTACSAAAVTSASGETGSDSAAVSAALFSFEPGGVQIELGADISPVLEALGDAKDVFKAPSCAFDGEDRIYYYAGYTITTYPDGDLNRVLSVAFNDDTIETGEGAYLGLSEQDIADIYGAGDRSEDGSIVSYFSGDNELRIFFEDGHAAEITFFYLPVQQTYDEAHE